MMEHAEFLQNLTVEESGAALGRGLLKSGVVLNVLKSPLVWSELVLLMLGPPCFTKSAGDWT